MAWLLAGGWRYALAGIVLLSVAAWITALKLENKSLKADALKANVALEKANGQTQAANEAIAQLKVVNAKLSAQLDQQSERVKALADEASKANQTALDRLNALTQAQTKARVVTRQKALQAATGGDIASLNDQLKGAWGD